MLDPRRRDPSVCQSPHPFPVEAMPLAALAQVPPPVANDLRAEPGDDLAVGRDREVREVPTDDAAEPLALLWYRVMPTTLEGQTDGLERRPHPLGVGTTGQQEPTAS